MTDAVFVTGGAGFIGYHLVHSLVSQGIKVSVLDMQVRPSWMPQSVQYLQGDIRSPEVVKTWLYKKYEPRVINLAAESNVLRAQRNPDFTMETSWFGTGNIIKQVALAGGHVVHASSREVYGDPATLPVSEDAPLAPKNVYGLSKASAEVVLKGSSCSILRLGNVIGTHDPNGARVVPKWLMQAALGLPLPLFGGQQVIDFIPVDVVVSVMCWALFNRSIVTMNVASGFETTLLDLAKRVTLLNPNSQVELRPANTVEVARFRADVSLMRRLTGITVPDPLIDLPRLAEHYAQRARSESTSSAAD